MQLVSMQERTVVLVPHRCALITANQIRQSLLYGIWLLLVALSAPAHAQDWTQRTTAAMDYIAKHADSEDMVMMQMRDGVRLYALILFPKDRPRTHLPTVLIRTPYNWSERYFSPYVQSFLENGYAVVFQSERGRYFSEGTYTYLVGSGSDGYDTVEWLTKQPWSNGKVGTFGCSSSAEEQHKLQGTHPPGLAAAVPMGSGAGIGKVGPYNEMGNFYRGGAVQMLWFQWYYSLGYTYRPLFPADLSRETMIKLHRFWNLDPETLTPPPIDTGVRTLPINTIMTQMGAMPSDLDNFINRLPNDPRWKNVDFGGEEDRASAPILMINSWYDMSIGPNVSMFEYQVKNAATEAARRNSSMIIAPTLHCEEGRVESEHTIVGERDMGDARFDYVGLTQKWFDHFLKGLDNEVTSQPKVRAYMMGVNQWRSYKSWPPEQVAYVSYYLDSDGRANSLYGDGRLSSSKPAKPGTDGFTYDPLRPVPSLGGSICCFSSTIAGGSFDQSSVEMRNDVLVYTTPPLTDALEITGPVKVSLYLSSDRSDTDLTVKLLDVYPDGKAYNLDESIQRTRWRGGWDKPVFLIPGQVSRVEVGPLVTSNAFLPGHRIRIEVSSSNFPHFERNLNTGGNNYDEKDPLVAHNVIHHGPEYPSVIVLPVIPRATTSATSPMITHR